MTAEALDGVSHSGAFCMCDCAKRPIASYFRPDGQEAAPGTTLVKVTGTPTQPLVFAGKYPLRYRGQLIRMDTPDAQQAIEQGFVEAQQE